MCTGGTAWGRAARVSPALETIPFPFGAALTACLVKWTSKTRGARKKCAFGVQRTRGAATVMPSQRRRNIVASMHHLDTKCRAVLVPIQGANRRGATGSNARSRCTAQSTGWCIMSISHTGRARRATARWLLGMGTRPPGRGATAAFTSRRATCA